MAVEATAGVATGTAFNPLLLGTTLGFGVYNAFNTWGQAKQAQAEAEKRRKRLDALMSKNRQEQSDVTQQATADATDMRTNYITARDPNKAQGLAQMYQSGMNNFRNTIAGLKQAHTSLEAQREEINAPTNAEAAGQVGAGLASTALSMYGSYKAGQAADLVQHNQTQFMKSLSDPMHKYEEFPNQSFSDQIKNMFGGNRSNSDVVDSWKAPSIDIAEMPEKPFSRSTYESNATKFYDDKFLKSDKWNKMKSRTLPSSFSSQLQFRSLGGF